jgi:hypothetical protein
MGTLIRTSRKQAARISLTENHANRAAIQAVQAPDGRVRQDPDHGLTVDGPIDDLAKPIIPE